ncbi:uncharacterized protein TNCV_213801 [Trichonephila clavipes]|nr:uncharacterized protein TNCV_213801 [Trichonephila clavipes]
MDFTEINSRGKRGELLGRIDRQNSRFRTAKTIIIKLGLHASFVELKSAKNALNEVLIPLKTRRVGQRCTLNLSRAETSSRWCGVVVRRGGVPAQVSSTSLDHGSKLRGPSPKALV